MQAAFRKTARFIIRYLLSAVLPLLFYSVGRPLSATPISSSLAEIFVSLQYQA
jgi:hypothetical protein